MNIFVLSRCPRTAARLHCDKHVVKMILESGQMLCAAHWMGWAQVLQIDMALIKKRDLQGVLMEQVPKEMQPPWRMTHTQHPCTLWTCHSQENYMWHSELGLALCREYTTRYNKVHKSLTVHSWLSQNLPPAFSGVGSSKFAVAMPDECKVSDDPVECYRSYYMTHKRRMASWKTQIPYWWI